MLGERKKSLPVSRNMIISTEPVTLVVVNPELAPTTPGALLDVGKGAHGRHLLVRSTCLEVYAGLEGDDDVVSVSIR